MALKDYPTSELQAEVMRRQHNCPFCVVMRAELDSIAGALGAARMDDAGGWHYEAVAQLLRELDHAVKRLVDAAKERPNDGRTRGEMPEKRGQ